MMKNEGICPVCGKKFRFKLKTVRKQKYCSKKCYVEGKVLRQRRFRSLGTSTHDLTHDGVKKQLFYIRNNIDKRSSVFNNDKSQRDVYIENFVYDEDYSDFYIQNDE